MKRWGRDRKILEELLRQKKDASTAFPGRLVLAIGRRFLRTPYRAGTLETKGAEHLVVNLREFDCTTFVETVIALAWCVKSGQKSFEAFRRSLQKIRYRQGRLQGYPSRLHYFSDWIYENRKRGLLKDVTGEMGGKPFKKVLNFMTTHPDRYPLLRNAETLGKMKSVERAISRRSRFLVPKKLLRRLEDRIQDGDLIAITTNREGLDVQHLGFAVRVKNRIHFLHASSQEGKVVLSKQTLYRYLMKGETRSGIIVVRLLAKSRERREIGPRDLS